MPKETWSTLCTQFQLLVFIVQTPKSNTTTRGDCVENVHSLCLIDICQGVSREVLLCLLTTVRI